MEPKNRLENIDKTAAFIEQGLFANLSPSSKPITAMVLGSGFGPFTEELQNLKFLDYAKIPHFSATTVVGHQGRLCFGTFYGTPLLVLQGRFHLYEGHDISEVVLPLRALKRLGIQNVVLTNAAGGINPSFRPGDLMMITDHINLMGLNPLFGPNLADFGPRFPDMSFAYDPVGCELLRKSARKLGLVLREGVYAGCLGPCYETPAEVRMLRTLGGDAVGMSTVPETIVARHMGMRVIGLSCISNLAAGMSPGLLIHDDVVATSKTATQALTLLLKATLPEWIQPGSSRK